MQQAGLPARDLDDAELERQGSYAHATRNWVFLHGTAEQFQRHTERMLELEAEYLRRHPKRTWQGAADQPVEVDEVTRLRAALRGVMTQLEALLTEPGSDDAANPPGPGSDESVARLLAAMAAVPDGRMHRLEVHQAARRAGVHRAAVARLYRGANPLLRAEGADRILTGAGRSWLAAHGAGSGGPTLTTSSG